MNKFFNKIAFGMMLMAAPSALLAEEQKGLGAIVTNLKTTGGQVIELVTIGAMIVGVFFVISGIFGLKKASDPQSGGQATYGSALMKIAVGALLMTPLGIVSLASGTTGVTDNNLTINKGTFSFGE